MAELDAALPPETSERDRLILEHVPLLKHIAGRMSFDVPGGLEREDLCGFGMLGLIAAAESWDSARGLRFSTYAYPKIRGAILDELRRRDFLPRGRREQVRELERIVAELEQRNGLPPSPEEMAAALGVPVDHVDEVLLAAKSAGEAALDVEEPKGALAQMLSDPRSDDPVGSAEWTETKALLVEAIQDLPEQERTVITLYYGEELLLRDIGEVLGVSESRVSQVHSRALYRLNRALKSAIGSPEV